MYIYKLIIMEKQNIDKQQVIDNYVKQLNQYELIAYQIAIKQLETSFDIEKSIGFLKYISDNGIEYK